MPWMPGNDTVFCGGTRVSNMRERTMVRPKKHLGQHFLRDENIARKITGYLDPDILAVLEIGPGTGILTNHILENETVDLLVVEVDAESVEHLRIRFPGMDDRIIHADFLKMGAERLLDLGWQADTPFQVIGNFPYNISSQILFRVLEQKDRIRQVVGMFQKEVAERIASPPGSKQYGILSVLVQAYYEIDYLFTVNESVFFPQPKVKSAVIRLKRNGTAALDCDESLFFTVVKTAFNQRRKTLRNSTRALWHTRPVPEPDLLDQRPEQLSVQQFVDLTRLIDAHSAKKS